MTDAFPRSPFRAIADTHGLEVGPGGLGIVVAGTGVGKSAMLVHLALERLVRGQHVLHVALRDRVEHVRAHYDEVFRAASHAGQLMDRGAALVSAERGRMIHSYRDRPFHTDHLETSIAMLGEVAQFAPRLVVVDGLDPATATRHLAGLRKLASTLGVAVWASLRSEDGVVPSEVWAHADLVLRLVDGGATVRISHLTQEGSVELSGVSLDPATMLVLTGKGVQGAITAPRPGDCTVYSGGANGAERAFGEAAARWGVTEVNFTFDGHKQARTEGRYELSPRELAAGDVSLVYVSRRLNRTYTEGSLIRKVLQTLWHMVSRSQVVFVVGDIQPDGTVTGGTGWSVELARMWNKTLWVYDQQESAWFRWGGHDWLPGTPVIESIHFCGTGTRYLTDAGQLAIDDLFERSFRPRAESA